LGFPSGFGLSQFAEVQLTWILKDWHYWRRIYGVLWADDKLCAATLRGFPHSQLPDTVWRPHIDPPQTLKLDAIFKGPNLQNYQTTSVSDF
jgi:hypothetical protein